MTRTPNEDAGRFVREAVDRFEGPLTQYAARLLGDHDRARDVVQDAFLRLCSQDHGALEGRLAEWLFTVCRNRTTDILRKEGRMASLTEEQLLLRASPEPGPPEIAEARDTQSRAAQLLETLPESQREVIRLKFQNGFSYREISRISGHSVSNVGYLIHVGLKAIRSQLADPQPAEAAP